MSAELVDSITGSAVAVTYDGHFVTVIDNQVTVLHLSKSAALALAAQLIEAAGATA